MRRLVALCVGILLLGLGLTNSAHGQKKKIEDLLKDLDSKNSQTRINACNEIGKLADVRLAYAKMALPQIRTMLAKDPDPKIRVAALGALGKIEAENKEYVANMLKYLKEDKDYEVQNASLGQLANYQQEAAIAINPLKERLAELRETNKTQDPGNIRAGIINTLVQINQNLSLPLGLEALKEDKAVSVKLSVLGRMQQMGQQGGAKQAVPVLIETYEASLKEGPSPELRRGLLNVLAVTEPKPKRYLPLLIETLKKDKDPAEIVAVIAALGRGGEEAKEAIPLILAAQKAAASSAPKDGSDPGGLRRTILESVVALGVEPKELVPLLVDTLKKDRDAGVKVAALGALGQLGEKAKDAAPAVVQIQKANVTAGVKDGNDPGNIRVTTLATLPTLGLTPKELVPLLTDSAQRDRNVTVRITAIKMLGDLGPDAKSSVTLLTRLTRLTKKSNEQDKQVAKAAEEALTKIKAKK